MQINAKNVYVFVGSNIHGERIFVAACSLLACGGYSGELSQTKDQSQQQVFLRLPHNKHTAAIISEMIKRYRSERSENGENQFLVIIY